MFLLQGSKDPRLTRVSSHHALVQPRLFAKGARRRLRSVPCARFIASKNLETRAPYANGVTRALAQGSRSLREADAAVWLRNRVVRSSEPGSLSEHEQSLRLLRKKVTRPGSIGQCPNTA